MVNVHEAKTNLSKLLARVEAGEEIVIARAGQPIAKLVPNAPRPRARGFGSLAGRIWMADDWDSDETNEAIARDLYADNDEDPI